MLKASPIPPMDSNKSTTQAAQIICCTQMEWVIDEVNASEHMERLIARYLHDNQHEGSYFVKVVCHIWALVGATVTALMQHSSFLCLRFLHAPILTGLPRALHKEEKVLKVKDISALAYWIELRIQQITLVPKLWQLYQHAEGDKQKRTTHLLNGCDVVSRIVMDILLGLMARIILVTYADPLMQGVHQHDAAEVLHVDVLRSRIIWLMGNPAGLKANGFVASVIGQGILTAMALWNVLTSYLSPLEPSIVTTIGLVFGVMGFSAICATVSDIVALISIHVNLFYTLLLNLYNIVISGMSSLWRLFWGKKNNMLRGRIDSCQYSIEQLLLGTIAFTTLVFICPTITAFYGFFTLVQLLVLGTQALLLLPIEFFHHVPLFSLVVYLLDPTRLPGGIGFRIESSKTILDHACNADASFTVITMYSYGMGISALLAPCGTILLKTCKLLSLQHVPKQFICGQHLFDNERTTLLVMGRLMLHRLKHLHDS